jgi:hypothetical protein
MLQVLPEPFATIIKAIVPQNWTFNEGFKAFHVAVPYVVALIISVFDIYVLKVYEGEKNEVDIILSKIDFI